MDDLTKRLPRGRCAGAHLGKETGQLASRPERNAIIGAGLDAAPCAGPVLQTSVALPIIGRSARAIEAQRGVAALANTLGRSVWASAAPCAALRWRRATYDISSVTRHQGY